MPTFQPPSVYRSRFLLPAALWVLVFLFYLPAAKAGRVADFPGLYADWMNHGFVDYLNRRWSFLPGMYQLTQLVTWCWFSVFGINPWPWHLLQITLHAANAWLLYQLVLRLLQDAGYRSRAKYCALAACGFFALQPYAVEAVVWEPAYHYPQALLLQLCTLLLVRRSILYGGRKPVVLAALVFFLSTFTLELFYLTPLYTALLLIYYCWRFGRPVVMPAAAIFLPQGLLMGLYFVLMRIVYSNALPRDGGHNYFLHPETWMRNPSKNLFNLVFFGRFFPGPIRLNIYRFLDTPAGMAVGWAAFLVCALLPLLFLRSFGKGMLLVAMLVLFVLAGMLSTGPLQFDEPFKSTGDRYLYCALAPFCALLAMLLFRIRRKGLRLTATMLTTALFIVFLVDKVRMWEDSGRIVDALCRTLPYSNGKTILLVNVPQVFDGIPMFGAGRESGLGGMRDVLYLPKDAPRDRIIEVNGYNMMFAGEDGAAAEFTNDSTVRVTLHNWGRWWILGSLGATDYDRPELSVSGINSGHFYDLHLHMPADSFVIYRQQGAAWYRVDPPVRSVDTLIR